MNTDYQAALTDIVRRTRQNQLEPASGVIPELTVILG
jgi:hypothetical protein